MTKEVIVQQNNCVGCGMCAGLYPEVFTMNDDGKSEVINQATAQDVDNNDLVNSCPMGAIQIKE